MTSYIRHTCTGPLLITVYSTSQQMTDHNKYIKVQFVAKNIADCF